MMNGNKIGLSQADALSTACALKDYLEIFKVHLCLYIGLSAIFGHVMARQTFSFESLFLGFFVMVLACGAAVLNNIQDREYDSFFLRTCNRSLPQGRVPIFHAKMIAMLMIGCGLSGLLFATGVLPFFCGVMAVICYNALYTPLKKQTLLAIVPGTLSGMLPPLIGWAGTEKAMSDPDILMIMIIFGLWQVPHFFILLLKTKKGKSDKPGLDRLPCFSTLFSKNEMKLQILIWTSLYSLAIVLFLMNGSIKNHLLSIASGLNAVGITLLISSIIFKNKNQNISIAFAAINISILFFMGAGICDKCDLNSFF